VLSKFFDGVEHFQRFSNTCLDVDPVSMALALSDADCSVCGDGGVSNTEECDDGEANSNTPGACRSNCQRPSCGDHIVDPQEQCDSDYVDCNADCTLERHEYNIAAVPGLVGYWPLDGDGVDASGNGLDGELVNVDFVPGRLGQAF
jgi:hypothetical protein